MPSVYVETSVFGAYVEQRGDTVSRYQRSETHRWWAGRDRFDLFCPEAVLRELERAPFPGQSDAIALAKSIPSLALSDDITSIANLYRKHLIMPDEEIGDALHLALAVLHEMDFLVTWNCGHLANANKTERILTFNAKLGLLTPRIVTPPMLGEEH